MPPLFSRRSFIHLVGKAGGAGAVYHTMAAMGLLEVPGAYAGPPELPGGSGRGVRVAVLGAGIAGMVAAYELRKAGYQCTVLEARARPGGRSWTLRGGDTIEETDSTQRVAWDAGNHMYFDPGPTRLSHHHRALLDYCRTLDVPLEVMINESRDVLVHDDDAFGGRPQRAGTVKNSAHAFVAQLAAKALDKKALDEPLSPEDDARIRAFVQAFGGEGRGRRGSHHAHYQQLLLFSFWRDPVNLGDGSEHVATMLQPVGGMDRIAHAFARALGPAITYNAEVTQLRKTPGGARVVWRDRKTRAVRTLDADCVVCTIPPPVLRRLDTDLAPDVKRAIAAIDYVPAVKIAFQADRRFWELDDEIYGGISWTTRDITQMWYPSTGIHQKKGILVGGYIWTDAIGEAFAAKTPAQRIDAALASGERLHPGYGRFVSRGVSVAWSKIPYSSGAWAAWSDEARRHAYPALLRGDDAIYFAGEHMSHLGGWQESAVRSAHHVIEEIAKQVRAKKK